MQILIIMKIGGFPYDLRVEIMIFLFQNTYNFVNFLNKFYNKIKCKKTVDAKGFVQYLA